MYLIIKILFLCFMFLVANNIMIYYIASSQNNITPPQNTFHPSTAFQASNTINNIEF